MLVVPYFRVTLCLLTQIEINMIGIHVIHTGKQAWLTMFYFMKMLIRKRKKRKESSLIFFALNLFFSRPVFKNLISQVILFCVILNESNDR